MPMHAMAWTFGLLVLMSATAAAAPADEDAEAPSSTMYLMPKSVNVGNVDQALGGGILAPERGATTKTSLAYPNNMVDGRFVTGTHPTDALWVTESPMAMQNGSMRVTFFAMALDNPAAIQGWEVQVWAMYDEWVMLEEERLTEPGAQRTSFQELSVFLPDVTLPADAMAAIIIDPWTLLQSDVAAVIAYGSLHYNSRVEFWEPDHSSVPTPAPVETGHRMVEGMELQLDETWSDPTDMDLMVTWNRPSNAPLLVEYDLALGNGSLAMQLVGPDGNARWNASWAADGNDSMALEDAPRGNWTLSLEVRNATGVLEMDLRDAPEVEVEAVPEATHDPEPASEPEPSSASAASKESAGAPETAPEEGGDASGLGVMAFVLGLAVALTVQRRKL